MSKSEFFQVLRKYYRNNYFPRFRFKNDAEVLVFVQFDLMAELMAVTESMQQDEVIGLMAEIIEKVQMYRNENQWRGILYYSVRIKRTIEFHFSGKQVFYYVNEEHMFEVFIGREKMVMDENALNAIIKAHKKEDLRIAYEEARKAPRGWDLVTS